MKKQGKRYKAIKNQIPEEKQEISNALKICKETANAKFDESIDVVFSLSCIDWNIEFKSMLLAAWNHVRPGGSFVATFRLTNLKGVNNFEERFCQYKIASKKRSTQSREVNV